MTGVTSRLVAEIGAVPVGRGAIVPASGDPVELRTSVCISRSRLTSYPAMASFEHSPWDGLWLRSNFPTNPLTTMYS